VIDKSWLARSASIWRRPRGRRVTRYIVLACLIYVASLVMLLAAEDWLLFPGTIVARNWSEPADSLNVRDLTLHSADGNRIHAWFSAPNDWKPQQGAILISHGNGNNLSSMSDCVDRWRERLGRAVLLYDYPGYGKSSGHPSEAGCYTAGEAALAWLTGDQRVPVSEIVLVGESLGGAVAVELATRHSIRLLVLHNAFTSFPDMAQARLPWYPSRYLVHNQMDNEAKIRRVDCPILITHGTADKTVPFHQGERLFAAAHEPKQFLPMEGQGHEPPNKDDFFEVVKQFLSTTANARKARN
jgi:uncharacterized protein